MLGRLGRASWILTFHAACGRMLRREARAARLHVELHDLRPGRPGPGRAGLPRGSRRRPQAVHAARHPQPDLEREEPADRPGRVHEPRRLVLRQDGRRGLRALPEAPHLLERGRLRRHPHAHGRGLRALPGGARALAAHVPLRPGRRVPGHEPRPVPPAAAARRPSTGTCSRSATRTSRSTASAARTSTTSSTSSGTSPARGRSRSSRTTAPRTRSWAPRTQ